MEIGFATDIRGKDRKIIHKTFIVSNLVPFDEDFDVCTINLQDEGLSALCSSLYNRTIRLTFKNVTVVYDGNTYNLPNVSKSFRRNIEGESGRVIIIYVFANVPDAQAQLNLFYANGDGDPKIQVYDNAQAFGEYDGDSFDLSLDVEVEILQTVVDFDAADTLLSGELSNLQAYDVRELFVANTDLGVDTDYVIGNPDQKIIVEINNLALSDHEVEPTVLTYSGQLEGSIDTSALSGIKVVLSVDGNGDVSIILQDSEGNDLMSSVALGNIGEDGKDWDFLGGTINPSLEYKF